MTRTTMVTLDSSHAHKGAPFKIPDNHPRHFYIGVPPGRIKAQTHGATLHVMLRVTVSIDMATRCNIADATINP